MGCITSKHDLGSEDLKVLKYQCNKVTLIQSATVDCQDSSRLGLLPMKTATTQKATIKRILTQM